MSEAEELIRTSWDELQTAAWAVRQRYHLPTLMCAVPGGKRYETEHYKNTPYRFAHISLTGRWCGLMCEHCRGVLLEGMIPVSSPEDLVALGRRLIRQGCRGVLISGGAGPDGAVPLRPYLSALSLLKEMGLQVIVHTGLLDRETARGLKKAGVDQALLDIVGDEATTRQVFHLDRRPQDYAEALATLREAGVPVAPHLIIGLHFGQIRGELTALEMIRRVGADVLVVVVLRPLPHTPMDGVTVVGPDIVGRLVAVARLLNPTMPLMLGCARPSGPTKGEIERLSLLAGVNSIAYPDPATVRLAEARGLKVRFVETCCTLAYQSNDTEGKTGCQSCYRLPVNSDPEVKDER